MLVNLHNLITFKFHQWSGGSISHCNGVKILGLLQPHKKILLSIVLLAEIFRELNSFIRVCKKAVVCQFFPQTSLMKHSIKQLCLKECNLILFNCMQKVHVFSWQTKLSQVWQHTFLQSHSHEAVILFQVKIHPTGQRFHLRLQTDYWPR